MNDSTIQRCIRKGNPTRRLIRPGATLLELIVVILIMLMITAATIPVLSPSATGRRTREAARMVTTFLSAARARALETGRPAGVWIERMADLPEAANTLHYAEIPQVYTGDYLDSAISATIVAFNGTPHLGGPALSQDYWNVVEPRSGSGMYDSWSHRVSGATSVTETSGQLVHIGDQLRFEGSDQYYTLNSAALGNGLQWYIMQGKNTNTSLAALQAAPYNYTAPLFGTAYSGRVINGGYYISWFPNGTGSNGYPVRTSRPRHYQLYRRPTRLQAGSIQLPQGTVIDLNFSSLNNGTSSEPGMPLYPRTGTGGFLGPPINPTDDTPIILVFSPTGHMEQFWCQIYDGTSKTSQFKRIEPYGDLYLLVGQQEFITPSQYTNSAADQLTKNWTHPATSLWIRVNTVHGSTTTAMVDPVFTTMPALTQTLPPATTATTGLLVNSRANANAFAIGGQ